jgi:hypothetical protein
LHAARPVGELAAAAWSGAVNVEVAVGAAVVVGVSVAVAVAVAGGGAGAGSVVAVEVPAATEGSPVAGADGLVGVGGTSGLVCILSA